MGGDITVRSIVNMGTTFRMRIPLPKEAEAEEEMEAQGEAAS
jgi:signal transduction histidine kinase